MTEISHEDAEEKLRWLEALAEEAYSRMYDSESGAAATGHYSDAKEFLHDAAGLARRLGKLEEADRLTQRLAHIKSVFRNQFSS